MEKKKYVRIRKSSGSRYWYTDKIGEVFEVMWEDDANYAVYNGSIDGCLVVKEDAELIVTEKRPAKVGERVLITAYPYERSHLYDKYQVIYPVSSGSYAIHPFNKDVLMFLNHEQYEVIVNNEVKNEEDNELGKTYAFKPNLDAMGYDELIEHGEAVMRAISLRSYDEGYKQGKFDADIEATYMRNPGKTAQKRRDEIVEQAKADYWKLVKQSDKLGCVVNLVVNEEKRTVVALIKDEYAGYVYTRGIAKAAPDDCFNIHIGKAIALHRALGLEVPEKYLNTPQPTEVRVGDVVLVDSMKNIQELKVVDDGEYIGTGEYKAALTSIAVTKNLIGIIDDSRTEEGE
ncbi:hypothetical protein 000TH008_252 [Bacillus phage 000TH008]|nr:hypothetical protein 000TH008_252 [Bacillus phage 000TH008]QQO40945.1 hypothetical protein 000TH009_252 [Bacillus phage 000TH009]